MKTMNDTPLTVAVNGLVAGMLDVLAVMVMIRLGRAVMEGHSSR